MAELKPCAECGMLVEPREYHPYAACLMFKACHDGDVVRANLSAVHEHGRATDGQRAGVPEGWRISMDEEGISIESPSGDGCYLWDIDQRNSDALRPDHYREVFRQLCQDLIAAASKDTK